MSGARVVEIYHGGLQALVRVPHPAGFVLVVVGVPDSDIGTARALGCTDGLVDVWPFGDSLGMWCPEGVEPEEALDDVHEAAIEAWVPLPLEWPEGHHCPGSDGDGRPLEPIRVTCGTCGRSWCERCDPCGVSTGCHFCTGRGYTEAEL